MSLEFQNAERTRCTVTRAVFSSGNVTFGGKNAEIQCRGTWS